MTLRRLVVPSNPRNPSEFKCEARLLKGLSSTLQEKSNQEIDLTFKLKSLQQSLEQEEAEHKATKAKLADKNTIYQSIEEAKSEALRGEKACEWSRCPESSHGSCTGGISHLFPCGVEMECTLQEERSLKLQVEGKLLQLEKDHSMLDCDYKQAQNKLDELQAQKEKLSEEVRLAAASVSPLSS